MIKRNLFLSIAVLGLLSCNNNDDDTMEVSEPTITGKWQPSKYMAYSGKDGSIIANESSDANVCDKKGSLDMSSAGKWHEIIYFGNTEAQCQVDAEVTGDYTYDSASKKIHLKNSDGTTEVYTLKKITNTELEVITDYFDTNGDGIKDEYTNVYKKL
ncbi:hypothetical protein HHL23_14260 [Chryseobacterium sp. RP-3-3]|uniref:Lipocalin-like domain-containing protein n=1 Tax=Chryseobacterium antibioticum TaxID=2728847 RepID=A0A7Y0FSZ5_9FLAO|nr:lipocalin family protein [Chryseobacterium antibioticum]NML70949.1 hypothetical protein [Chryseobacterium antibioticum]